MLKTIGFVLFKKNISELDREYCFFTKKYGKIRLLAKSVKKSLSKLTGQLEPPSLVNFIFTPTGEKGLLITALAKKSFVKIRRDYEKLKIYERWCFLIDCFTLEKQPDHKLWKLLKKSLSFLEKKDWRMVNLYFICQLIDTLGLALNTKNCAQCHKKINQGKKIGLAFLKGGFLCHDCSLRSDVVFDKDILTILDLFFFENTSLNVLTKHRTIAPDVYKKTMVVLENYLNYIKKYY